MESRRYLRCLGQPALFAATGEPIRFRTRKHLALLVYLAVDGRRVHPRDRLAELLWPTGSRAEARHSLATALSILRPRVGPGVLETDRERVVLLPDTVALDLDRLLVGDILGSDVGGPLEVAAFLDGFDIPDSSEFTVWKDRQQARLLPAIKDALIVLIDRCRRTGDSRAIEQLADRMLALDELSEDAVRAKMEARAFAGDRLTALKIFEAWREKAHQELGAAPSALLEGIAARLRRRGWERGTLSETPIVPTDQWRGRSFIGRGDEYRLLYEAWERMRKGSPSHALVLGDSGIGKSTLAGRLVTAAGLEGAAISRVQCYDLERTIPYSTIGNLIRGLLDRPGVSGTPPEALAELAHTVPQVQRRFPSVPTTEQSQGETARIRLAEAFYEMLVAIAEEHPVILVVDDLHLADDASLSVLHFVLRRSEGLQIMLLLIARAGELSRSPQAARLREAVALGVREIELGPMTEMESRELLRSLISPEQPQPGAAIRRSLLQAAAGYPMALELLVQDWQRHGDESLALAVGAMTVDFLGSPRHCTAYQHILSRIITALDPHTHNVLNLAAMLGNRLDDLGMYSLLDLTPAQCMAGLSQLADLRILRDGSDGLEFANELIRAQAYAAIPSSIRRNLHGSIADRLLTARDREGGMSGLEIAWHCIRAGRQEEAIPHLLRGARESIGRGAPHEAQRALVSALPKLHGLQKVQCALLIAEVLQEQGCWRESLDVLQELGPQKCSDGHEEAIVLAALAKLSLSTSAAEDIYDRLPELTGIVKTCPVPRTRVRAARVIAYLLERHRNERLSSELFTHIDAIPTSLLDADAIAELDLARALLLYQAGQTARSLDQATNAVTTLRTRNAANLVIVQLYSGLGALCGREGHYEEAVLHLEQAFDLAHRLDNDTIMTNVVANLTLCLGRLGRYAEQSDWVEKLSQSRGTELTGFAEVQLTYALALGHAIRNRPQAALESVERLETRLVGRIPDWIRQAWLLWKADILHICGRKQEALKAASQAIGAAPKLYTPSFAGPFSRWLSLLAEKDPLEPYLAMIDELVTQVESFDALDQAEILCAKCRSTNRHVLASSEVLGMLRIKLSRLPLAVRSQLHALEILPDL